VETIPLVSAPAPLTIDKDGKGGVVERTEGLVGELCEERKAGCKVRKDG
jgi:hypothetical protein